MVKACLVLGVRCGVLKVVMMVAEVLSVHPVGKLAVWQRVAFQTGVHASLVERSGSKDANIPILGRIGASFSA